MTVAKTPFFNTTTMYPATKLPYGLPLLPGLIQLFGKTCPQTTPKRASAGAG